MKCLNLFYIVLFIALVNFTKAGKIYQCTEDKTIALTFDDGPFTYTKPLVDYLISQPDVKATFFTVGKFHYPHAIDTPEYQEAMKTAHDHGFQIASHTFQHKISDDVELFRSNITLQEEFIEKVTGHRPSYFRAPKGNCTVECEAILDSYGYKIIQWDVDTRDWDHEGSGSEAKRVEDSINILNAAFAENRSNYLILMHDTESYTVSDIVPWIIEKSGMKEKGYRFVTVAECLGDANGMYKSSTDNNIIKELPDNNSINKVPITNGNNTNVIVEGNSLNNLNSGAFSIKSISLSSFFFIGLLSFLLF